MPEQITPAEQEYTGELEGKLQEAQGRVLQAQAALWQAQVLLGQAQATWQSWADALGRRYRLTGTDHIAESGEIVRAGEGEGEGAAQSDPPEGV